MAGFCFCDMESCVTREIRPYLIFALRQEKCSQNGRWLETLLPASPRSPSNHPLSDSLHGFNLEDKHLFPPLLTEIAHILPHPACSRGGLTKKAKKGWIKMCLQGNVS